MKKEKKNQTNKSAGRSVRNGGYSFVLTAIVLAIVVVINVVVEMLPAKYTKFDMSPMEIFTLSETSKEVINSTQEPVTIYTIAEPGKENVYMQSYVELFAAESSKITLDRINPTTDIQLMDEFQLNNVVEGSVVVAGNHFVCDKCGYESAEKLTECPECKDKDAEFKRKIRYINYNNTFTTQTNESTGKEETVGIDMEGQITSALVYVSTTESKEVYYFTGHGEDVETAPSKNLTKEIEKLNMGFQLYNFDKYKTVPNDADIIILNGPNVDYDDAETQAILDFLEKGGSALIDIRLDTTLDFYMPNFERILAACGVEMAGGGVLESNSKYYYNNAVYSIKPSIRSHAITSSLLKNSEDLLVYLADALVVKEDFDNANTVITPLITTSPSAYLKERGESSMKQTEDDPVGTFNLGVAIESGKGDDSKRVVIYSTHCLMMDAFSDEVNGANFDLLVNSVSWLGHQTEVTRVGVKKMYPADLIPTTDDMYKVTILVAVIIPLACFVAGGVVWYRRRK